MPRITTAELEEHERQKSRPGAPTALQKASGELLAIFVAGKLVNPLNASAWGWRKRSRTAKAWKERTALALLERHNREGAVMTLLEWMYPKRVAFLAHVHNRFDGDGLQAALKPVRDALVECGVISGDADRDGHEFVYSQVIDRARRGVEVRVSLR